MAHDSYAKGSFEVSAVPIASLLSPELLVTVFEYLDARSKGRVARVCRMWRDVAYIPSVWKDVEVTRLVPVSLLDIYIQRGISQIESPPYLPNAESIDKWLQQVSKFSQRNKSRGTASTTISIEVSCTFNNLTVLSATRLVRGTASLLTSITLTECSCVSSSFFNVIAEACPNLEDLFLLNTLFYRGFYHELVGGIVWNALVKLRRLERLGLLGWSICDDFFECLRNLPGKLHPLADTATLNIPQKFHLPLTSLLLENSYEFTDESLKIISQTMPCLVELCLSDCDGITYKGVEYLTSLKELRSLKLPCLRPEVLGRGMKQFSVLDENGNNYNDLGVSSLATSGVLSRLKTLYVVGISDKSMGGIARYTRHSRAGNGCLVELQLRNAVVTDKGLLSLASDPSSVSTLLELSLYNCSHITDNAIGRLAKSNQLANLRYLDLTSCGRLSDVTLQNIASGFPSLRCLSLRECSFTDAGIKHLVLGCRLLTSLDLSHCRQLTARCLYHIARYLDNLEHLAFCGRNYRKVIIRKGFQKLLNLPRLKSVQLTVHHKGFAYELLSHVINGKLRYTWS